MGTEANAQSIPMTAAGIRPPYLQNVRLGVEEEKKQSQQNQSFLQKYVSILCINCKIYDCIHCIFIFFYLFYYSGMLSLL